jgi:hypothetical protein
MSMLISIDAKKNQILHPEVLKLCDSFAALTEKEMLAVVLYADYSSIYKQFPEHERKRKAIFHAFDDNVPGFFEKGYVQSAVNDYMSLQYNPKIELIKRYQKTIDSFTETMEIDSSPTFVKKTIDTVAALRKSISDLENEVDEQTLNDGVIKGNMQLSHLERIMSNKKHYQSIIAKK